MLWAYARTREGCQYQSFSFDNGNRWSDPTPSRFTSPCSPMQVKRLWDGKHIMAVWNPIPEYITYEHRHDGGWGGRTPLALALSADEGASWSAPVLIEDGTEDAGYCYPAVFPMEHSVLLAYCAGRREDGGCLNRLRIRKISLSGLL